MGQKRPRTALDLLLELESEATRQGGYKLGQGGGYIVPPIIEWKGEMVSYSETRKRLFRAFMEQVLKRSGGTGLSGERG
jgi:hypothetical protein